MKKIFITVVVLISVVTVVAIWVVQNQGVKEDAWLKLKLASVGFDDYGIPTIAAESWPALIEAQGYVVASERLWQMDLLRRFAGGRLSEWFGEAAIKADEEKLREDRLGIATRAAENLKSNERMFCELYAKGVNKFIVEERSRWGLEYSLLREKPEKWQCRDTMLVILHLAEYLTTSYKREVNAYLWREHLTDEWQNFLFPKFHPWAKPIFGKAPRYAAPLPPRWQFLPKIDVKDLAKVKEGYAQIESDQVAGSNGWAITHDGATLLAGDPHLSRTVPQIWYANRLRISSKEWVVGASLPGVPGVIIGMNQSIGWTFTNLSDDVDDLLKERIDKNNEKYLAYEKHGKELWQRIKKKRIKQVVRGGSERFVDSWHTHRGPLVKVERLSNELTYSRQWLAFKEGSLNLPVISLNRASDWQSFNRALDGLIAPSLAAVFADRQGNVGLRCTGQSIDRRSSGRWPLAAVAGEWKKLIPVKERKRKLFKPHKAKRRYVVSANSQVWSDKYGHRWFSDDRRRRIDQVLKGLPVADVESMRRLQNDTHSEYHRRILNWIEKNSVYHEGAYAETLKRWKSWDGLAESAPRVFTEAIEAEKLLSKLLITAVKSHFFKEMSDLPAYRYRLKSSWILKAISNPLGIKAFGLNSKDLASHILKQIVTADKIGSSSKKIVGVDLKKYFLKNTLKTQHPFVGRVPVIGGLFKVRSFEQFGYKDVVKAESPVFGPSVRIVWDMKNIMASRWIYPVGQSGHVRSMFYRKFQKVWHTNESIPVFNKSLVWH